MDALPEIDLRHLMVLSDDTGILQHATRGTPDLHHGYCTDDNARSLIATVKVLALPGSLWEDTPTGASRNDVVVATQRYMAFLHYAFNPEAGRFRNFMLYDRSWLEEVGSEDSHARTIWGLGKAYRFPPNDGVKELAEDLLIRAIPATRDFEYLRPQAYTLLGLSEYLRARSDDQLARSIHDSAAEELMRLWRDNATDDWPWWEPWLTWGNAKLPHALLVAGMDLKREEMTEAALKSLRWMLEVQTGEDGQLSIIGNNGWYTRGERPARYDQQPIEAKSCLQACLAAAEFTGESYWREQAVRCFQWFTGRNDVGQPLYNPETGGGHDGLMPSGVNANQGAESTLAYLMSVLELHLFEQGCAEMEG
jgi:hypothetical protein